MKKKHTTILLLFIQISIFSFGQVSSIEELRLLDVNDTTMFYPGKQIYVSGYYKANDGGGGMFIWSDTSTKQDNDGTIIKPYNDSNGRFERVFDRQVNILWFGAKRDGSQDISVVLKSAIQAAAPIKNNTNLPIYGYGEVIIPGGTYKVDSTILITTSVNITGVGSGMWPYQEVRLLYKGNTKGFDIRQNNSNSGARAIVLKNMYIRNSGISTDSSANGIFTNTRISLENIAVENFGGNGFHFQTNDSGNANNSLIVNCVAYYNNKSGLFISGGDCNNIGIYSSSFNANGMCGVLDNSFLGNMYFNCHTSSNGLRAATGYSRSWCLYNNRIYQCIKYPSSKGIEPTVSPDWKLHWLENPGAFYSLQPDPWSADTTYWITGSYVVSNIAATSSFYGCYSEGGQGANMLNNFSVCYGGDHGAIFASGNNIWLRPSASQLIISGAGVKIPDMDSTLTFSGFNNKFGLQLGSIKSGHGITQMKYYEADRTTKLFADNSTGNQAFSIVGKGFNPAMLGLSTLPRTGMLIFPYYSGYWMGDVRNGGRADNFLSSATGPPTSFEHRAGSWCWYSGIDTTIVGWKCTVTGTPGTWVLIKSGN